MGKPLGMATVVNRASPHAVPPHLMRKATIAALMLTTEALVAEIPEKKPVAPMPGGGRGPDMDYRDVVSD